MSRQQLRKEHERNGLAKRAMSKHTQMLLSLGEAIADLRKAGPAGRMSQKELADKVGVTQSYLSEIECGKAAATLPVIFRICDALSVPFSKAVIQAELAGRQLSREQSLFVEYASGVLEDLRRR